MANKEIDLNNDDFGFFLQWYKEVYGNEHLEEFDTTESIINISDSTNSDQWAIVRISDYQVTQSNPKFINYKLTLEEQV